MKKKKTQNKQKNKTKPETANQMAWDDGEECPGLTCWFWGELVPVGGAHGQETVA